jgi:hypothetical protein
VGCCREEALGEGAGAEKGFALVAAGVGRELELAHCVGNVEFGLGEWVGVGGGTGIV